MSNTLIAHMKDSKNLLSNLRHLVSALPSENFRTLKYLVAFLVLASKQHSSSKMNVNALSTVFGPNIFKWLLFLKLLQVIWLQN